MKEKIFVLFIITSFLSCKVRNISTQQIIAVEEHINYYNNEIEIPDNTYFKDVNNLFDEFIGTWQGSYNNKNYAFIISKVHTQSSIRPISYDKLMINYKVTDNNGNILVDTTNLPNSNLLVLQGQWFIENGETYQLSYYGVEEECGDFGDIWITVNNNNNNPPELDVRFFLGNDTVNSSECPDEISIPFPQDVNFTLTKQ